jgi:chemotaxis protein histidine kinase CheA
MSSDDEAEEVIATGEVAADSASEDDDEVPAEAVEVAVAEAEDSDDKDDDDNENNAEEAQDVQATVVVDEDDEEDDEDDDDEDQDASVEAVAVVAEEEFDEEDEEPITSALKTPKKTKRSSKKNSSSAKSKNSSAKRRKRKPRRYDGEDGISGRSLKAANAAREMLLQAVPSLPIDINDSFIVRSFGQLNVEAADKFSSSSALYPVGFCCDRYEFSPIHGRVLKLRCGILDSKRARMEDYTGPVFRVMWGQGVDEDVDKVEYPYDPYTNSAPITSPDNEDVVAIPAPTSGGSNGMVLPNAGMRVKVRFEKDKFYYGTIQSVDEVEEEKKKKKRKNVDIMIQYDDGSSEEAVFPDPDITLVMPGTLVAAILCYSKLVLFTFA